MNREDHKENYLPYLEFGDTHAARTSTGAQQHRASDWCGCLRMGSVAREALFNSATLGEASTSDEETFAPVLRYCSSEKLMFGIREGGRKAKGTWLILVSLIRGSRHRANGWPQNSPTTTQIITRLAVEKQRASQCRSWWTGDSAITTRPNTFSASFFLRHTFASRNGAPSACIQISTSRLARGIPIPSPFKNVHTTYL